MKLLIRNLARSTTEAELCTLFETFGVVQSCTLVIDKVTGTSKGFGFIEMPKQGAAKAAMKTINGQEVAGNRLRVKKADPKQSDAPGAKSDPLHGVTLEIILTNLVSKYGWEKLGQIVNLKCFTSNPSVASSLKFLRSTPWAREKVEALYLNPQTPPTSKPKAQPKPKPEEQTEAQPSPQANSVWGKPRDRSKK